MALARSKVTSQGQVSIPLAVRRRLGVGPGSTLEWDDAGGQVVLRRAGRFTSEDVHRALFGNSKPKARSLRDLKAGIARHVRSRHARD